VKNIHPALKRFALIFAIVLTGSHAVVAATLGRFPAQVQTNPVDMTGRGFVPAPTPTPHVNEGHYPAGLTTANVNMTGRGYVPAPTPTPHVNEGHYPATITVPSINMTGTRGS
jgi:hypothetical protein